MSALHLQPRGPACNTPSSKKDAAPPAAVMGVGQVSLVKFTGAKLVAKQRLFGTAAGHRYSGDVNR